MISNWKVYMIIILVVFNFVANAQQLYVSTQGNDSNPGTLEKPFATITRARDAIRKLKKTSGLPAGGITVWLRGGNYLSSASFELNKDDSGEEGKQIIYKAYQQEEPVIIGGIFIDNKNWKPLNSQALKRVNPKVEASKLVELDVKSLNLKNVKEFAPANQFTSDWYIIDLFANNKRQPISQWPNPDENIRGLNDAGWTTANGSKNERSFYYGKGGKPQDADNFNELDADGSNRSGRWSESLKDGHELWLKGLWRTPWEPVTMKVESINTQDGSITFTDGVKQGMGSKYSPVVTQTPLYRTGSGKENWFMINYLDEIDQPGEWALDFKDQKIYYYPPSAINDLKVMISDMKAPLIRINAASYVQFQGLTLQGGLGNGVESNQANHLLIAGCKILNIGNTGISINGGSNNTLQANDIAEAAGWGMEITNVGSREALLAGNLLIKNNHIHHVGKLAFKEAIIMKNSVGVTIANNLLHDIPKGAIRTDDVNNCLFEYNEIHNIALKEGDTGVFYNYGGWSTYGNIFRYNFSHHTNRANGFYCDDGDSGDHFYKNIIQGSISAVKFGGGHDNVAENNLIVESKDQTIDDRGKDRNYRLGTRYETNLTRFNLNAEPWKSYFQILKSDLKLSYNSWSDMLTAPANPEFPNGCRMENNVAVASGLFQKPGNGKVSIAGNTIILTVKEAGFYNYPQMDLRTDNAEIKAKFPELNEVFPKIGLYKDEYRNHISSKKETGGLSNRSKAELIDTEDKMVDKVIPKGSN